MEGEEEEVVDEEVQLREAANVQPTTTSTRLSLSPVPLPCSPSLSPALPCPVLSSACPSVCLSVCQRLRGVYWSQVSSACPQRDVLYHCAVGLSLTGSEEDGELSQSILHSLLDGGYMRVDCHLSLAKLLARQGFIVRARSHLVAALQEEPSNDEAREFQRHFDQQVKRDGKWAVYGGIVTHSTSQPSHSARGTTDTAGQQRMQPTTPP